MITVISGTNRPGALSEIVARHIFETLSSASDVVHYVNLQDVPADLLHSAMYSSSDMSAELKDLQESKLIPADKWIIVSPEYNGSFPGVLKLFLDAISINQYADTFKGKKLGLIGVASGRAGNLRGMDHLAGVANHVGMISYPDKRPVSQVTQFLNEDKTAINSDFLKDGLASWCEGFKAF